MAIYDEMSNQGLQIFQEAYGRAPESDSEMAVVQNYNTKMTQSAAGYQQYPTAPAARPATVYDTAVNNAYETQQSFAQPNAFLQTIKAGLSAKLQPQEENLGTSQLFEKAGLTGYSTLAQSMAARTNQLIKSGTDLAKALQSSAGVYTDYYNLLNDNYKTLLSQQEDAVKRQYEVEDQIRDFNNKLYLVQRQEELDRETEQIKSQLSVWESGQKASISQSTTAWENALSQQTYAYKSGVDIAEEEAKTNIGLQEYSAKAEIDAGLATLKEQLKRETTLSDAQINIQVKEVEAKLKQNEDLTQAQLDVYVAESKEAIKKNTAMPSVPTTTQTKTDQPSSGSTSGFQLPSGYEKIDGARYSTRDAQRMAYDDIRTDPTGKFLYGKPKAVSSTPATTATSTATHSSNVIDSAKMRSEIKSYKQMVTQYNMSAAQVKELKQGIMSNYGMTAAELEEMWKIA
jgi:hypothetical protein